jgi:hypothetical protein
MLQHLHGHWFSVSLVDDPEPTHELDVKVLDTLVIVYVLTLQDIKCWLWVGCWF